MEFINPPNSALPSKPKLLPHGDIYPFILLASCFMWWGIANNMTDPLVKAFTVIFSDLSTFQSSMIQFAFYGAYFSLAIPGAVIARKFSYKSGILIGLGLYCAGCFLLFPAGLIQQFLPFLIAFYVLASGLSILETNANPYILSLGPEKTSTQRLNLAQSFNPVGSVIGTLLCQMLILARLEKLKGGITGNETGQQLSQIQSRQLFIVITPYLIIGAVLVIVWLLIAFKKMPYVREPDRNVHFIATFQRLFRNPNYLFSVIAQFFYVGAQLCVWTFTVYYIPSQLGIKDSDALKYHTAALVLFGLSRFICTALMSMIKPHNLLAALSTLGGILTCVVIFVGGNIGVYSLVAISGCMSLMFPTIFGLGSRGLGRDRKIGGSGLIMAILGAAVLVPVQAFIIQTVNENPPNLEPTRLSISSSYIVPLFCFIVIAAYGIYAGKVKITESLEAEAH
ncbi:MAG TPA: L-fucose:H+ symporter permease [Planctomycetes bacterium]|nr:L-fucose:H+ symporter permease [Planctomycetota bacterium]